jgi:NitT/TauT family transport system ATP-binding protein
MTAGAEARAAANGRTGSARIEVADVSLAFANPATGVAEPVLDRVSLTVEDGEFVSLIGPSGCGKTTLLNAIAGFIAPDSGRVEVDGVRVAGIQAERTAFMFARDALLPWRTAVRNVELGLRYGRRRSRDRQRAVELLELVGLGSYGGFYPAQLSQGMRQRVALARTLATDRDILLMDEPFGALDAQTKTVMENEFSRIWEQSRKTVVFVTHDLMEAVALSDRVVVMSHRPGRIKAVYRIDLPRPRVVIELPSQPKFNELYRTLWEDLKPELRADEAG